MTKNRKKGNLPTGSIGYKTLKNRSGGKVELLIEGSIKVILPMHTVRVPEDFDVPRGIGLFVV